MPPEALHLRGAWGVTKFGLRSYECTDDERRRSRQRARSERNYTRYSSRHSDNQVVTVTADAFQSHPAASGELALVIGVTRPC